MIKNYFILNKFLVNIFRSELQKTSLVYITRSTLTLLRELMDLIIGSIKKKKRLLTAGEKNKEIECQL